MPPSIDGRQAEQAFGSDRFFLARAIARLGLFGVMAAMNKPARGLECRVVHQSKIDLVCPHDPR
jgi:hypothetical protein